MSIDKLREKMEAARVEYLSAVSAYSQALSEASSAAKEAIAGLAGAAPAATKKAKGWPKGKKRGARKVKVDPKAKAAKKPEAAPEELAPEA